jgi:hypothetical protein
MEIYMDNAPIPSPPPPTTNRKVAKASAPAADRTSQFKHAVAISSKATKGRAQASLVSERIVRVLAGSPHRLPFHTGIDNHYTVWLYLSQLYRDSLCGETFRIHLTQ